MTRRNKPEWVVFNGGTIKPGSYALECRRCGAEQPFEPHSSINYIARVAKAFAAEHKRCKARQEVATEDTKR